MRYEPTGRRKIIEDAHRSNLKDHIREGSVPLTVVEKERLDPDAPDHVTLRIGFEGQRPARARPNDYLLLRWHNTSDRVAELLERLDDDPDRGVTVKTFHSELFPGKTVTVPLREALSDHVEVQIAGAPILQRYKLDHLTEKVKRYKEQLQEHYRMADGVSPPADTKVLDSAHDVSLPALLDTLNGSGPDTDTLLSLQPRIAHRPYTMSAFRRLDGHRFYAEITVSIVNRELTDIAGNPRIVPGRATSYLSTLKPGDTTSGFVLPDRHHFPQTRNLEVPLIIFSTGAGIAGPLSLLRSGYTGGPLWIIYGIRDGEQNFLYRSELEQYLAEGTIDRLDVAQSRPSVVDTPRQRVTDIVYNNAKEFVRWLDRGAHVFMSGRLSMGVSVNRSIVEILAQAGRFPDHDRAYRAVRGWYEDRRFQASVSRV